MLNVPWELGLPSKKNIRLTSGSAATRSEGRGTADNLAKLCGDLCLPSAVVNQGKLFQHFTCILGRVLHGCHSLRLLCHCRLDLRTEDGCSIVELVQVIPNFVESRLK